MKDRMTLGRDADVAETAALTLVDERATDRIIEALDMVHYEKCRKAYIDNAVRRLKKNDRAFARAVLKGFRWRELCISKQAFYCKLKKVCNMLQTPVNKGRKRHADAIVMPFAS